MLEIIKLNAYGGKWHVLKQDGGIVFSTKTKRSCLAYIKRRNAQNA